MRARRTDANHAVIAKAFEQAGCVVHKTNSDWDLTVQLGTQTELVEVKNPATAYGKKGLNPRQERMRVRRAVVVGLEDVERVVRTLRARNAAVFNGTLTD